MCKEVHMDDKDKEQTRDTEQNSAPHVNALPWHVWLRTFIMHSILQKETYIDVSDKGR